MNANIGWLFYKKYYQCLTDEDYRFLGDNINNRPELNVHKWLLKGIYEYNNLDYY